MREGDLEALPFADASFDAVTAVNSLFYADDMGAAMRELVRVVRPGGRVVVTAWGPPERCEFLTAVMPALGPLMPPPPPGAPPPHPGALSEPGALAAVLKGAGLRVVEEGEVACPFVFPEHRGIVARECQRRRQPGGHRAQRGGRGSRRLRERRPRPHAPGRERPLRKCLPLGGGRTTVATIPRDAARSRPVVHANNRLQRTALRAAAEPER